MIDKIEALGQEVETLWQKEAYAKEVFPEIAFKVLQENKLHERFNLNEFLRALWERKGLPKQLSMTNDFGQPPITFYFNTKQNFLIDIYFWVTPEISIHSHGFRGAFTVLHGESLQCLYDFDIKEPLDDGAFIGDLSLKKATLLKKGEVQKILPGPAFIHQVWHIGFPTV